MQLRTFLKKNNILCNDALQEFVTTFLRFFTKIKLQFYFLKELVFEIPSTGNIKKETPHVMGIYV